LSIGKACSHASWETKGIYVSSGGGCSPSSGGSQGIPYRSSNQRPRSIFLHRALQKGINLLLSVSKVLPQIEHFICDMGERMENQFIKGPCQSISKRIIEMSKADKTFHLSVRVYEDGCFRISRDYQGVAA
jgi:hypothetical protein